MPGQTLSVAGCYYSYPPKGEIPFPGPSWPVSQAVKTPPFHGGNAGSIPARATMLPCWTWLKMLAGPSALMGKSYVLKVGFEPTRLAATDFESAVSAYSIHFSK